MKATQIKNKGRTFTDNVNRWRKSATLYINKQLQNIAEETEKNVSKIVAEKLEETYKNNIIASYTPRSAEGYETQLYNKNPYYKHKKKLTYHHTNTLVSAVYTVIEDHKVKAKIRGDVTYPDAENTPATQVYEWLTQGTRGTGKNYYYSDKNGEGGGRNYPTEIHPFELWTQLEMNGFMDSLQGDIKNGKYSGRKYKLKTKK